MSDIPSYFVLPKQSFLSRWAEALAVMLSATLRIDKNQSGPLACVLTETDVRPSGRAFLVSSFCHFSVVLLLISVPYRLLFDARKSAGRASLLQKQIIYYDLREIHFEKTLPNLISPGVGGKPGRGSRPRQTPSRGSEAFHPRLTMVMNPPAPDSTRQTIIQPASPPELKIAEDLKLPNILIGSMTPPQRPPLPLRQKQPRAPERNDSDLQAPIVVRDSTHKSDLLQSTLPVLTSTHNLDVPIPLHLGKPRAPERNDSDLQAPIVVQDSTHRSDLLQSRLPVLTSTHNLGVPNQSMSVPRAKSRGENGGGVADDGLPNVEAPGNLLAMGVNPGVLEGLIAVSSGNRYGAFSISPVGGLPGSPGGIVGGDAQGGSGGLTGAGDGSSIVGPGSTGGGNNHGGSPVLNVSGGIVGFSGAAAMDAGNRPLIDVVTAGQVFPVLIPPRVRGLNVQVITGPSGGGGLAIYRVLPCDKIYTIALPMPSKDWILQYCTRDPNKANRSGRTASHVLHLDQGLVAPDIVDKFDFKRPPVPPKKASKLIVLRGAIAEDGSVAEVTVISGADPTADTLAAAAFRQWKFQPALQSGKPVRVEILVGVPATTP